MEMCAHEICLLDRFEIKYFAVCHHRRKTVIGSYTGWSAPLPLNDENIGENVSPKTQVVPLYTQLQNSNDNMDEEMFDSDNKC